MNLLIVDDHLTNLKLLRAQLESEDHTVFEAHDGVDALALLERQRVDAVISDILMPRMDGYRLCHEIRKHARLHDLPIIIYTSTYTSPGDQKLALDMGADKYLKKPVSVATIVAALHEVIAQPYAAPRPDARPEVEAIKNYNERLASKLKEKNTELLAQTEALRLPNAAMTAAANAILIANRDGIIVWVNPAYTTLTGYTLAEAVGKNSRDLVKSGQQERAVYEEMWATILAGRIWHGQIVNRRKDGSLYPEEQTITPVRDANGEITHFIAIKQDLSERKKAEQELRESERRFSDMLGNVELVSVMLDHEARITYCNEYLLHLTGWRHEEVIGRNWSELFVPPEINYMKDAFVALLANRPEAWHRENEILTRSGERRLIRWNNSVLRSGAGDVIGTASIGEDITERKRAEQALVRLVAIIEATPDMVATAGPDGVPLYCNQAGLGMLGFEPGQNVSTGRIYEFHPEWARKLVIVEGIPHAIEHGSWTGETALLSRDGREMPVSQVIIAHKGDNGAVDYLSTIIRDISVQKENERRITRLNRLYTVLSGINTAIVRTHDRQELFEEACRIAVEHGRFRMAWIGLLDADGITVTPVARAGIEEGYLDNMQLSAIQDAPDGCTMVARALQEQAAVFCNDIDTDPQMARWREEALRRGYRSIAVLPLQVGEKVVGLLLLYAAETDFFDREEIALLTDLAGDISFALGYIEKEKKLNYLAYYDVLTGLPNRALLYDRLEQGTRAARRNEWPLAVLFVDLDNFKTVNDTLGDTLLQEVARRLASCLRDTDTVGRLGGDEFGIILPEIGSSEDAAMVARKVIESCARPHLIEGHELFVSASVGITLFPDDAVDSETLIRNADTAMYRAKDLGRNTYQFFTAEMNQRTQDKMRLETDLRYALAKGEFLLHYQPKVSCVSGKITGFEALLRWQHPLRGLVGPDQFIPALEETGLMVSVGAWVLASACAQTKHWHDAGLGTPNIAVNISGRQTHVADPCEMVQAALAASGLAPAHLELELTESQLMKDAEGIIGLLRRLKAMGVQISVDDFGTGYSSLAYLKRFPLDSLKIDRAFVRDIIADPNDVSITRAIITLAHNLKLKVVAEGVETEGQLGLLIANHCDEVQGYYFSRPLPVEEATALLRAGRTLDSRMLSGMKRNRTLLLVDDEANILSALKRLLRRDGYDILTAQGAVQGLELLASHPVDVIVSDQRMPGMSGVEFLRRVKTLHPRTVRLVLSGYTDLQAVTDAINEGAIYKFLTKPWDDGTLRANIEEAFRSKEMADENRRMHSEVALANAQMAVVNAQLQKLLASKVPQAMRDQASRDIAQEAPPPLKAAPGRE